MTDYAEKARNICRPSYSGAVTLRRQGRDRYGRTLAHVYVGGRDVARLMIEAGHAVPYHCPGGRCQRRIDWCGGAG